MLESNLNQERERLQYLATHDPLTKLLNRTALMDMIPGRSQGCAGSG